MAIQVWTSLASLRNRVTPEEAESDSVLISEFLDYVRWLADQDTGVKFAIGELWALYHYVVREGQSWTDACEHLEFPIRTNWFVE